MKKECPKCGARMKFDIDKNCYVCLLCGFSTKDVSEIEKPSYIG